MCRICFNSEHKKLLGERDGLKSVNKLIVSKNAELGLEIRELQKEIILLTPIPIVPVTDLVMISREDYLTRMLGVGIEPIGLDTPLDRQLSLTSKVELDRIAPYLVYPADLYIDEIWDCEDYGIQAQTDASKLFHVSGIRLTIGDTPFGKHGWLITMDKESNKWWLESNSGFPWAGEWFRIGENGYVPKKVFA